MNQRRFRILGVGLTAATCAVWVLAAEQLAADVNLFGKKKSPSTSTSIPDGLDGLADTNPLPPAQPNVAVCEFPGVRQVGQAELPRQDLERRAARCREAERSDADHRQSSSGTIFTQ